MSTLRVDFIINEDGSGSPEFTNGIKTDTITDSNGTGAPSFPNGIESPSIAVDNITDIAGTGSPNFPNKIDTSQISGGVFRLMDRVQVLSSSSGGTINSSVSPTTFPGSVTPEFVMYFASAHQGGILDLRYYSVNSGSSFSETTLVLGGGSDDTDQGSTADIICTSMFVLPYKENQDFYVRYGRASGSRPDLYIWAIGYQV